MNPHIKPTVHYVFSVGFNCATTDLLVAHKYRIMSSPFDYMYIDFESALKCISTDFADFVSDIVIFSAAKPLTKLIKAKNTTDVDSIFIEMLNSTEKIMCNNEDYSHETMFFNQNYLDTDANLTKMNLYNWGSICMFCHHNMLLDDSYDTLTRRGHRMKNRIETYPSLLVYISKPMKSFDIVDVEILSYLDCISRYNMKDHYFAIILLIDNDDSSTGEVVAQYSDRCLFMTKYVSKNDGDKMTFDNENEYIKQCFDIQLLETNRQHPGVI